jgi:hypothetical protein
MDGVEMEWRARKWCWRDVLELHARDNAGATKAASRTV